MALSLSELTEDAAATVLAWAAEAPSTLPSPSAAERLLDGEAVAVLDDGALVGVLCVGTLAAVPGGPLSDAATDVWLVVAPSRRGEGVARRAAELALETLRVGGHTKLRTTLGERNAQGRRLALHLGFQPVERRGEGAAALQVLEREVLA